MVVVQIGICGCDKRVLNKTSYISDMQNYNCDVYESCSVMNPVFILRYNSRIFNCNYAYVQDWHRYYYINDIVLAPSGKMIISCHEDVLMTNKESIKKLDVNVVRNQSTRNKLIYDEMYSEEVLSTVTNLKFNRSPFILSDDYNTVLAVIGGKANDV